tara:strand:+ start:246 stop:401 length:156 start_codon:yes stop_codon:yes gene_type:complete
MARVSWLDRQDREDRVSFNSNKREGNREQGTGIADRGSARNMKTPYLGYLA